MEKEELTESLLNIFDDKIKIASPTLNMSIIEVEPENLFLVLTKLKFEESFLFNYLISLSGIDLKEKRGIVYHLRSTRYLHMLEVKSYANSQNPIFPSVVKIWPCANWYEREAFDMFGIKFDGHPNLTRLLLPDDWDGHPLLKDYIAPTSFAGISHAEINSNGK